MPRVKNPLPVDRAWFIKQFEARGISQAFVAGKMGIDPGQFSHMLRSPTRRWHLQQVQAIAEVLGVPVSTIWQRLGMSSDGAEPSAPMKITGAIDGGGTFTPATTDRLAPGAPMGGRGVKVFKLTGDTLPSDGVLLYAGLPISASECTGRICLIEDKKGPRIRIVRRGLQRGHFDLYPALGMSGAVEEDVALETASPVEWAKL